MSNIHTAECIEAVTRFLLYLTITSSIVHGLAEPEKRWFDQHSAFANDESSPVAQRNAHKEKVERSRKALRKSDSRVAPRFLDRLASLPKDRRLPEVLFYRCPLVFMLQKKEKQEKEGDEQGKKKKKN